MITPTISCGNKFEHWRWFHSIPAGANQRDCHKCTKLRLQALFCTGIPQKELPPAGEAEDFEYALRLHLSLNGRATNHDQRHPQEEASSESSDATLAWNLHREWNREEGGGADLSSFVSNHDQDPAKLCAVCHVRPAGKSSTHSSR